MNSAHGVLGIALLLMIPLATASSARAASLPADKALAEELIARERASWVAWQGHDASFFAGFLADDHVELGTGGPTDKATVVAGVASGICKVESYSVGDFRFTRLSADAAALIYRAEQKTKCGEAMVSSPVWATSVYALRDGRWQNVLYEQVPVPAKTGEKSSSSHPQR